jgi:hypothetical protein
MSKEKLNTEKVKKIVDLSELVTEIESDDETESPRILKNSPKTSTLGDFSSNNGTKITRKWSFNEIKAEEITRRPSMNNISKNKVIEYKKVFDIFDKDGDGFIAKEEFKQLLKKLGIYLKSYL